MSECVHVLSEQKIFCAMMLNHKTAEAPEMQNTLYIKGTKHIVIYALYTWKFKATKFSMSIPLKPCSLAPNSRPYFSSALAKLAQQALFLLTSL